MIITRRSLFGFLAAPVIIRVADLMPIKALAPDRVFYSWGQSNGFVTASGGFNAVITHFTAEELAFISGAAISWYAMETAWRPAE